jgi:hypothetical protein
MVGESMRLRFVLIGMVTMTLMGGCSVYPTDNSGKYEDIDAAANQIILALDTQDSESLKAVFSETALTEAEDIDEGVQYVMNFFEGESISVEAHGRVVSEHIGSPKNSQYITTSYYIETGIERYILRIEYWTSANPNARDIGVYRVYFATEEENNIEMELFRNLQDEYLENMQGPAPEWNYGASYRRAGIYWPGWDE